MSFFQVTCNRYWPKKGTKNAMFGSMSIILKHEEARENFIIRELIVVDGVSFSNTRIVFKTLLIVGKLKVCSCDQNKMFLLY